MFRNKREKGQEATGRDILVTGPLLEELEKRLYREISTTKILYYRRKQYRRNPGGPSSSTVQELHHFIKKVIYEYVHLFSASSLGSKCNKSKGSDSEKMEGLHSGIEKTAIQIQGSLSLDSETNMVPW